jgi:hypothetical protein
VPADVVANGATYFDARGPLRADWRVGDSVWSLVDGDALGRVLWSRSAVSTGTASWSDS